MTLRTGMCPKPVVRVAISPARLRDAELLADTNRDTIEIGANAVRGKNVRAVAVDPEFSTNDRRTLGTQLRGLGYRTELWDDSALPSGASSPVVVAIPKRTVPQVQAVTAKLRDAAVIGATHDIPDRNLYRAYMPAGVAAIVCLTLPADSLKHMLGMALQRYATIPADELAAVVQHLEKPPEGLALSERDRAILNLIAQGEPPASIAAITGYSDRHLRRITAELVSRIGAINRVHAAAVAARWGLGRQARTERESDRTSI